MVRTRRIRRSLVLGAGAVVGSLGLIAAFPGSVVASASPGGSAASVPKGGLAPLTAAQAKALSANVTKRVIVVFKDQIGQAPASRAGAATRRSIEAGEQSPVLNDLSATRARNVHSYTTINAVAATVSPGEQSRLASDPAVAEVVPDQIIQLASPQHSAGIQRREAAPPCRARARPIPTSRELAPQALQAIHADSSNPNAKTARSLGIDGSGVTVAYIADGLDTNNPDFIRADGQPRVRRLQGLHRLRDVRPDRG